MKKELGKLQKKWALITCLCHLMLCQWFELFQGGSQVLVKCYFIGFLQKHATLTPFWRVKFEN